MRAVLLDPPAPVEIPVSALLTFPTTADACPSRQPGISLTTDLSKLKLFSLAGTDLSVVCFSAALVREAVWPAKGLVLYRNLRCQYLIDTTAFSFTEHTHVNAFSFDRLSNLFLFSPVGASPALTRLEPPYKLVCLSRASHAAKTSIRTDSSLSLKRDVSRGATEAYQSLSSSIRVEMSACKSFAAERLAFQDASSSSE